MKKNFLSAIKLGKIVARSLGKSDLPVNSDGKVTLTSEERATVVNTFGERFASMLEATSFADESSESSDELFNAAVEHQVEARIAPLNEKIRTLQDTINTLAAQPEDDPAPQAVGQGSSPTALRVNMKAAINRMASSYLSTGLMPEVSASTLDITELTEDSEIARTSRRATTSTCSANSTTPSPHRSISTGSAPFPNIRPCKATSPRSCNASNPSGTPKANQNSQFSPSRTTA